MMSKKARHQKNNEARKGKGEKRLLMRGTTTVDPAEGALVGANVVVKWMDYLPPFIKGAVELGGDWTHFGTTLLAIGFHDGETLRVEGSAVLIGPGIALAANHVLEPHLDSLLAGAVTSVIFSLTAKGLVFWHLDEFIPGRTDVAILRLNLASEFPLEGIQCAKLSTRTPAVGEPVMILGARSGATGDDGVPVGEPHGLSVRLSVGSVGDIYPVSRDKCLFPWPCVAVRCLTKGGMSGGPAFDQYGRLIGILSTSIEDEEGPAYISPWWPAAANPIKSSWLPGTVALPTNLLEMANARILKIVGANYLTATEDDQGAFRVDYRHWT